MYGRVEEERGEAEWEGGEGWEGLKRAGGVGGMGRRGVGVGGEGRGGEERCRESRGGAWQERRT